MKVKRDFERIYSTETDPWSIGAADYGRYEVYRDLVLRHGARRGRLLDIGCGLGAFLSRFADDFEELVGSDVSAEALERAEQLRPEGVFVRAAAESLRESPLDGEAFDAIVYSDVIAYLDERGRRSSLEWIAHHLAPDGVALIAAWSPGGNYLRPDELERLVRRDFRILERVDLESSHVAFAAERRRRLAALTIDYETWQPIPAGKEIDWERDVLGPAAALLDACDAVGASVTLFVEMGEHEWLLEHEPDLAARMEEQWRDAARRGHDVQLHLHPSWLPELGATRDAEGGWTWDWSRAKVADYPGDLDSLVRRLKERLENAIRPAVPGYSVTCFRAGAYQAQPFRRLYAALEANGIGCDSSVYAGGVSEERGYDYRLAYSSGQPYFAASTDPQLKAPPSERAVVELPVLTFHPGDRWLLDGDAAPAAAQRLLAHTARLRKAPSTESLRRRERLRGRLSSFYWLVRSTRRALNRVLPRRLAWRLVDYPREHLAGHDYFVAIGHTKGLDSTAVARAAAELIDSGVEIRPLTELASLAREELLRKARSDAAEEAAFQVARDRGAVLGDERNEAQSRVLQELIPLDRERVLDLGCGGGYWAAAIAARYPWMEVVGLDVGDEFVEHARQRYGSARVSFVQGDFGALPFEDGRFDCVYADNSLEHAFDVGAALAEVFRVLSPGGALVAAVPTDARNPERTCDDHTWKTAPDDLRARLEHAGFAYVRIDERDTFRELGMPPYPPSRDRMAYVQAWKRETGFSSLDRAREAASWVHRKLDPARSQIGDDAVQILSEGYAFCTGYAVVVGRLLEREGFPVRWVTMLADGHPRGRGDRGRESHTVAEVDVEGHLVVVDAMANTLIEHGLEDVLRTPALAAGNPEPNERHRERGYHLYDTDFWYSRVRRYWAHATPSPKVRPWRLNRHRPRSG